MVTLKTAKQLKSKGFPQSTLIHYENTDEGWCIVLYDLNHPINSIAVPTANEIYNRIHLINMLNEWWTIRISDAGIIYTCGKEMLHKKFINQDLTVKVGASLDEALAQMWLNLQNYKYTT